MLRESFKKELLDIIKEKSDLYPEDFAIEEKNGMKYRFRIEYIFNSKFHFSIEIETLEKEFEEETFLGKSIEVKEYYNFHCNMCPGELFDTHQENSLELKKVKEIFSDWSARMSEDIKATSMYGRMKRIEEEFSSIKDNMDDIEDTYFTIEEAHNIIERLNDLEKSLSEHISDEKLDTEFERVKKDISNLNEEVYSLSKKNWIKKFFTRFSYWIKNPKNQELIVTSVNTIKKIAASNEA